MDGHENQDRIEKVVDLAAPVARVWRALTDHIEFGEWFRVRLDSPFRVGETTTGKGPNCPPVAGRSRPSANAAAHAGPFGSAGRASVTALSASPPSDAFE